MSRLVARSGWRHLARHPWQFVLAVLGVALGVAVVVSIDLANTSARRAFAISTETVLGRATHRVVGPPGGLPDELFPQVVEAVRPGSAAPVVEAYLRTTGDEPETLRLIGVDPLSEAPFRPYLRRVRGAGSPSDREPSATSRGVEASGGSERVGGFSDLLVMPNAVAVSEDLASRLDLAVGDELELDDRGRPLVARLVAIFDPGDDLARRAAQDLLVADIAAAQEMLARTGHIDRIDLRLRPEEASTGDRHGFAESLGTRLGTGEDDREPSALERVRALLPPGANVETAGARRDRAAQMTRAFRLNLTALSLLALVVGMFLIYNTITFSVVQRRETIGTLRALGVTRSQILRDVLSEAAVIGLLGTVGGLVAGVALGRQLIGLVSRTINDLYFVVTIRDVAIAPTSLLVGAALGIAATLVAALPPAIEATGAPPRTVQIRSLVESSARRRVPSALAGGALLLAIAGALLWLPTTSLIAGFGGLFALILACGVLSPVGALLLSHLISRPAGAVFGIVGTLAARGVRASLSRTAVAIAALTVAVSVTVGVGVMIKSFRETVVRWLDASLTADIYVSPPTIVSNRNDGTLEPGLVTAVRAMPEVARARTVRGVDVASSTGSLRLVTIDPGAGQLDSFTFVSGDEEEISYLFRAQGYVLVSEPLAFQRDIERGDILRIATDHGEQSYEVAGVFYDYASDVGIAMMHRDVYDAAFYDRAVGGIALFLADGADPETVIRRVREIAARQGQGVNVRSNRALRDASMAVFDRTFTITAVLRLLATIVAFIGVLSALMALQLERARELGVLRANGMTPGQVWGLVTCQTGVMGLIAGILSLPVGIALASVMIYVINRRSFGWSIEMLISPSVLLQALLIALAAALLAGIYPSWKMSRTSPAAALRSE